ncbi:hypothetical protein [Streptomyces sp. NBC_00286]|uniref:hypothetical protein n=1 Tax=Streptomyces sp. NBC_00286 TaxID=2975701 RepID=UPI003FA7B18E
MTARIESALQIDAIKTFNADSLTVPSPFQAVWISSMTGVRGAVRAEEREELALGDAEGDATDRVEAFGAHGAVSPPQVCDLDHVRGGVHEFIMQPVADFPR